MQSSQPTFSIPKTVADGRRVFDLHAPRFSSASWPKKNITILFSFLLSHFRQISWLGAQLRRKLGCLKRCSLLNKSEAGPQTFKMCFFICSRDALKSVPLAAPSTVHTTQILVCTKMVPGSKFETSITTTFRQNLSLFLC